MEVFGFGELPDELQQAMQEHLDKQQMLSTALHHDIDRLLDEMTVEQLLALRIILNSCAHNDQAAPFFEGQVAACWRFKHGRCGGCGRDHMEELLTHSEEVAGEQD
jgi:hypothetical protein